MDFMDRRPAPRPAVQTVLPGVRMPQSSDRNVSPVPVMPVDQQRATINPGTGMQGLT